MIFSIENGNYFHFLTERWEAEMWRTLTGKFLKISICVWSGWSFNINGINATVKPQWFAAWSFQVETRRHVTAQTRDVTAKSRTYFVTTKTWWAIMSVHLKIARDPQAWVKSASMTVICLLRAMLHVNLRMRILSSRPPCAKVFQGFYLLLSNTTFVF